MSFFIEGGKKSRGVRTLQVEVISLSISLPHLRVEAPGGRRWGQIAYEDSREILPRRYFAVPAGYTEERVGRLHG